MNNQESIIKLNQAVEHAHHWFAAVAEENDNQNFLIKSRIEYALSFIV